MILKAVVIWLILVVCAVANGVARNALITPRVGEYAGHVLSTLILCVVILLVSLLSIRWIAPENTRAALFIGGLWVGLTVAFEFIAGHYLFGHSWEKLLADYNFFRGRVWLLVLLANFVSPVLAGTLRRMW